VKKKPARRTRERRKEKERGKYPKFASYLLEHFVVVLRSLLQVDQVLEIAALGFALKER
jgi:hypothetical protein